MVTSKTPWPSWRHCLGGLVPYLRCVLSVWSLAVLDCLHQVGARDEWISFSLTLSFNSTILREDNRKLVDYLLCGVGLWQGVYNPFVGIVTFDHT